MKVNIFSKNKIQLTLTLILILFFSVTGATYAYFAINVSDNNTVTGNAATVNLTLSVDRVFPSATTTNTGVLVPQRSTSGKADSPLATALKNGCVDGNKNAVCQVYKIRIQNLGGTANQVVDGNITFYGNPAMTTDISTVMPNLRWKLINSVNTTTPASSVLGTNVDLVASSNPDLENNIFSNDITLGTNDYKEYYIIIWINETGSIQATDVGKSFYCLVEFNSSNGTGVTSAFTP